MEVSENDCQNHGAFAPPSHPIGGLLTSSIYPDGNLSFVWEFHGEFHGESPGFDLRCRKFGDFHVEKLQKDLKRINFDKKAATHGS